MNRVNVAVIKHLAPGRRRASSLGISLWLGDCVKPFLHFGENCLRCLQRVWRVGDRSSDDKVISPGKNGVLRGHPSFLIVLGMTIRSDSRSYYQQLL